MNDLAMSEASPGLARRVTGLAGSATVEMSERLRQAQAAGVEILPLASGDPNLTTDPAIIEATHRAMLDGQTRYGPAAGLPALRASLASRLSQRSGVAYAPGELLVTPGGKFAVFAAMMSVVESGDEVILLDPCWVSYGPCVKLCGGVPVVVPARDAVDLALVAAAITPRTRMIVVNSPVNPTGRILTRAELAGLLALAERHDLWLLFDQVYSDLTFEPGAFAFLQALPGAKRRTFVADSLSKTYGMTGWRIGYLAAPEAVLKSVLKVVQHSIYCVPPFLQAGAIAALSLPDSVIERNVAMFRRRRDRAAAALDALPGIECKSPPATFYLFPKVGGDDKAVSAEWLDKMSIAALPGGSFGPAGVGHLRLSLACSDELLEEALNRLRRHYLANDRVDA
jgi:aspartate/methionine/tyrosine aminotransferase